MRVSGLLGRALCEHLLRRHGVGDDLAALGQLVKEEEPQTNVFRPQAVRRFSSNVQCTRAAAGDAHGVEGRRAQLHHEIGEVGSFLSPKAYCHWPCLHC